MTDTQWPRYEVFEQEGPDLPHRNAGSVHAPDAEMALQNARDVFSRRPATISLWVAPASAIYARTAEQLAAEGEAPEARSELPAKPETYEVFYKLSQRQTETFVTHAGAVQARSPAHALQQARQAFGRAPVWVWWIVPARALTRSEPDDAGPMFGPAHDKEFRLPRYYPVMTLMREATEAGDKAAP